MDNYNYNYNNDFDSILSNVKNSISYVIENYHKFLLLAFVFIIIYFLDYVMYINTVLYSPTFQPVLSSLKTPQHHLSHIIKSKGKRSRRRRH